jgi:two-component system, chemotaxis family, chemotaxis protein CheY
MIHVWSGGGQNSDTDVARPRAAGNDPGDRGGTRVLVVDDDPSILDTVTAILSNEGYQVKAAGGGEEALALVSAWRPTLVLLDMRMPLMDGWAVARALREAGSTIPIVVMTAAENAKRWAEEIDAAGHIAKPFDLDELLDCVEKFGSKDRSN